ncbi:Protein kinase byr2, partial [Smittium culicis]
MDKNSSSHFFPFEWTETQVQDWLNSLGYEKYSRTFYENKINGEALLELNYNFLKDLEIATVGDRVKINSAIIKLRESFLENLNKHQFKLPEHSHLQNKRYSVINDSYLQDLPKEKSSHFNDNHTNFFNKNKFGDRFDPSSNNISSTPSSKFSSDSSPNNFSASSSQALETSTRVDSKNVLNISTNHTSNSSDFKSSDNFYNADIFGFASPINFSKNVFDDSLFDTSKKKVFDSDSKKSDSNLTSSKQENLGQEIESMKSISVIGPNGEVKLVGVEASESGKDILYSVLSSFGLMGDRDKDKYAIFHVSGEQGGARMLSHDQLFKMCTESGFSRTEKLFLKKRHQLTIVPPSAQRDAELQRAIEKFETILPPPPNSSSPFKQNQFFSSSSSKYSRYSKAPNSSNNKIKSLPKNSTSGSKQQQLQHKMSTLLFNQNSPHLSIKGVGSIEKIHSFFGQRPPSEQVHNNLAMFFPGNEARARNSIMRRNQNIPKEHYSSKVYNDKRMNHSIHGSSRSAQNGPYPSSKMSRFRSLKNSSNNNASGPFLSTNRFQDSFEESNEYISENSSSSYTSSLDDNSIIQNESISSSFEDLPQFTSELEHESPNRSTNNKRGSIQQIYQDLTSPMAKNFTENTVAPISELVTNDYKVPKFEIVNSPNEDKKGVSESAAVSWIKGAPIASGSFGSVYYGIHTKTGVIMAVKQVDLPSADFESDPRKHKMVNALKSEIKLLQTFEHKNIVQYLGYESTAESLFIFLEYVPGGSVSSALMSFGSFPESLVKFYISQTLEGLVYLHERNIIHCDIKGGNVLIDNSGMVKISDFGISKKVD